MLPANRNSSNSSYSNSGNINNTNRCLIKSAIERTVVRLRGTPGTPTKTPEEVEDVTEVEYDIINYYAQDSSPRLSPRIVVNPRQLSPISSRPGSTISNSSSSSPALDASSVVVVGAAPARRTVMEQQSSNTSAGEGLGGGGGEDLSHLAGEKKSQSQLHALPISRSRGGGGVASSRLRRQAAIVPARSIVTDANSNSSSSGGSSSSGSSSDSSGSSPTPSSPCSTLGVNMRVTGQCSQGGRKYMEDQFSVAYQESPLTHELEYAFFGIYDGHGGPEAAVFAKEHLMLEIVKQKLFWSDKDEDVLRAIREGYIATHFAMWREQGEHGGPSKSPSSLKHKYKNKPEQTKRKQRKLHQKYGGALVPHKIEVFMSWDGLGELSPPCGRSYLFFVFIFLSSFLFFFFT